MVKQSLPEAVVVVAQVSSLQQGTFVIFTLGESNFP